MTLLQLLIYYHPKILELNEIWVDYLLDKE